MTILLRALALLGLLLLPAPAIAQAPLKIGAVLEVTGPFAAFGRNMQNGMNLYLKQHGDTVAGRKVEILVRDTTGAQPDIARRLVQELVTRDKVDFIVGFGLTPNAMAVAPVVTEAKVPTIIMNAATSAIVAQSPYLARVSMTLPQVTQPIAQWAPRNGIRRVFTLVTDYGPGIDAETTFKRAFTEAGGQLVGEVRTPLANPDFAPFLQRIKDARPEAVFVFLPGTDQGVAFMKGFAERGLGQAGIRLIGTGDVLEDDVLPALGDYAVGAITSHHYSAAHDSPANRAFVQAYAAAYGGGRPNFMAVAAYDGMAAIFEVTRKLNGAVDGDRAMAALKGLQIDSPRGPITIDAATRDVVQTVYIRRVEKRDGGLYNIEFDKVDNVRDPGR